MIDSIDEFGKNAGIIYRNLNSNGTAMHQNKLQKTTKLTDDGFYGGIGWLARENKIKKTGISYKLGETNLIQKIGTNAGRIWRFLATQKEANLSTIMRRTNLNEKETHSALGWLARENKIDIQMGKNNQIVFRLK